MMKLCENCGKLRINCSYQSMGTPSGPGSRRGGGTPLPPPRTPLSQRALDLLPCRRRLALLLRPILGVLLPLLAPVAPPLLRPVRPPLVLQPLEGPAGRQPVLPPTQTECKETTKGHPTRPNPTPELPPVRGLMERNTRSENVRLGEGRLSPERRGGAPGRGSSPPPAASSCTASAAPRSPGP